MPASIRKGTPGTQGPDMLWWKSRLLGLQELGVVDQDLGMPNNGTGAQGRAFGTLRCEADAVWVKSGGDPNH